MVWRGLVDLNKFSAVMDSDRPLNIGMLCENEVHKAIDFSTSKEIRDCYNLKDFTTLKSDEFKARQKFNLIYGVILNDEWKQIFSCMHYLTLLNSVKDLQYKILHRFLPTNRLLFKMGKVVSPTCMFCELEEQTIEHLLYTCHIIKNFWIELFEKWNYVSSLRNINHNVRLITFGMYVDCYCPENEAMNILLLLGKAYIWQCKCKSVKPSANMFTLYLERSIVVCQQKEPVSILLHRYIDFQM